jgi:hypothetical protein
MFLEKNKADFPIFAEIWLENEQKLVTPTDREAIYTPCPISSP